MIMRGMLLCAFVAAAIGPAAAADWPQFRGPGRDGVSVETGLPGVWPPEGPRAVWRKSVGAGFSGIAVVGDRLYTQDSNQDSEQAVCLKTATGEEIWRATIGPKFVEEFGDGPRSTPTVSGEIVLALSSHGRLHALRTADGSRLWEVDLMSAFGGKVPMRGIGSSPLVDGDLVIVEGGGADGKAFQALDLKTGAVRWTSQNGPAGYASGITVTIDGVRQHVFIRTAGGDIVSFLPDGRVHWTHKWMGGVIAMPVFVPPNRIFASTAADTGSILIEIQQVDGRPAPREVWASRLMKNQFSSSVLVGGFLYGFDNATLKCIDAATGQQRWVQRGFGKGSLIAAGGILIVLGDQGVIAVAEATAEGYREKGRFQALTGKSWTIPTLAGGRLYVRDQDEIASFDLGGGGAAGAR